MDDEDTKREPAKTLESQPLIAFHGALSGVNVECAQLVAALRQQDFEDAEIAAQDAVASYLAAKTALRRLEARPPKHSQEVHAASLALEEARRALDDLFERASTLPAASSLQGLLGRLRISLAIANGGPLPESLGTRQRT